MYETRINAARDQRRLSWAVAGWLYAELAQFPADEIEQAAGRAAALLAELNADNGRRKTRCRSTELSRKQR
jgi:hypothetical protein